MSELEQENERLIEENISLAEEVIFLNQQIKETGETYYYSIPFYQDVTYVFSTTR